MARTTFLTKFGFHERRFMQKSKKEVNARKITWDVIYRDFRRRYPNLSKEVIHWQPHSYATIEIELKDDSKLLFNYDAGIVKFAKRGE